MIRLSKASGLILFTMVFCSTLIYSQSKTDKTVIGSVGKEKITYGELKRNIQSSSGLNSVTTLKEMEEFLPIYLEYRAKIKFAEQEGFFKDPELVDELDLYAKQASYSQWLDNKIKQTEFEKYYDRASTEIKSEHLLIALPQDAPPADTLAAYQKLIEARNKFLNGSTISELDPNYSSKQNGRSMGGDLPWFSMGTTVKEFEDVIFSLEKGEISMPFRTQFGYHIVHLQDKRSRTLSRDVSHIFARAGGKDSKSKIDVAYNALKEGREWSEVVSEFSDDNLSAKNNGQIGWINYGRYNSAFVDSIMALDSKEDYSKPIKTAYGYHIFKIDSVQTFETESDKRETYMDDFLDSPNFKKSNSFVINWFKNTYNSEINSASLSKFEDFLKAQDSTKLEKTSFPSFANEVIYTFREKKYSVSNYHNYLKEKHPGASAITYLETWMNDFITYTIDSQIIEMTISEFPEFQKVMDNYRKGLAVYQINDTYLWSAATVDTLELVKIYEADTEQYTFPKRYYYHMLSAREDSSLDKAASFIDNGNSPDSVRKYIPQVAVNKDSTGVFIDAPYDKLSSINAESFSDKFEYKNRKAQFYLNEILPARRMTFDEAFNRLLTDYQPAREAKWLAKIKKQYKVKMNLKALRSAYKKDDSL